jgi:hypothetical protein
MFEKKIEIGKKSLRKLKQFRRKGEIKPVQNSNKQSLESIQNLNILFGYAAQGQFFPLLQFKNLLITK